MMKTLSTVLTLAAAMMICPKLPAADDPASERRERVREHMAERMADLSLTDEQETKIADVRKECRPKIQEAVKELAAVVKEEVEKVREVLTPEQREKARALKEERKENRLEGLAARVAHLKELDLTDAETAQFEEIREEFRPKVQKVMKDLASVLTEDQKKAREAALKEGKRRREIRESLNLSDEQKQKIEANGKELVEIVREELQKMKSVLSAEQQEKIGAPKEERRDRVRDRLASAIANFKDLDLNDEQRTKISAIREEYRPKVHEAANKLRSAVREEISQILEIVKG